MLIRSSAATSAETADTAEITLESSSSALVAPLKPLKAVIFNADIAEEDLNATMIELIRLKQAGYTVVGTSAVAFTNQPLLMGENGAVVITDVTDEPDTMSMSQIHTAIRVMGIPVFAYGAPDPTEGEMLSANFKKIFGAIFTQIEHSGDWMCVEGFWVDKQPTLNRHLKGYAHAVGFKSRLTPSTLSPHAGGSGNSGSLSTEGGVVIQMKKKHYHEVGGVKFTVDYSYLGKHYAKMSTALNHVDNSLSKRVSSLFSSSQAITDNNLQQQLLLLPDDESMPASNNNLEGTASFAARPRARSRFAVYLIAAVLTLAAAACTFLLLPLMMAAVITAAVGLTSLTVLSIFNRNRTVISNSSMPANPAPHVDFEEPSADEEKSARHNRNELLNTLRRARHSVEDEKEESVNSVSSASIYSNGDVSIEEVVDESCHHGSKP